MFIESTKHYLNSSGQQFLNTLQAPGAPIGNICRALNQIVEICVCRECRGCLLTNSIVELAPHDKEVRRIVQSMVHRVEKTLNAMLDRAVQAGEISPESNTRAIARILNSTVHGLVVMGKASASRAELKDVVRVALSTLR